jgi:putative serine protease PepD
MRIARPIATRQPSMTRPTTWRHAGLAVTLAAAVAMAGCSSKASSSSDLSAGQSASTAGLASAPGSDPGVSLQQEFVNVVKKVRPSVVEITTDSGLGSGVVYDTKGDIVTNDHVVGTAQTFQVTFFDGQTVAASLVGAFPPDDLAVIRVSRAKGVNPATFADSSQLQVGDIALAIGNPLGFASSVTEGIVSYNGRTVGEGNGVVLPDTVQTSAAINPGNSGGALVDIRGQVIGIPTLAATDPQLGGGAAAGIGFAIPANTVKLIAGQLVASGKVVNSGRAALGLRGATATDVSGQPVGVIVAQVQPGGAAAKAGIQAGDVITKIDGQPTPTLSDLETVVAGLHPDDTVTVTIVRPDGTEHTVNVTLENLPGQ